MNPQLILALVQLLMELIQHAPEIATEVGLVVDLLKTGGDPTPEQEATIRTLADRADDDLKDVIATRLGVAPV